MSSWGPDLPLWPAPLAFGAGRRNMDGDKVLAVRNRGGSTAEGESSQATHKGSGPNERPNASIPIPHPTLTTLPTLGQPYSPAW